MGFKINFGRLPRLKLPGALQREADKLGASQALGKDWAFLADLRDPLLDGNIGAATDVLISSPLSSTELFVLAEAARAAATAKEPKP